MQRDFTNLKILIQCVQYCLLGSLLVNAETLQGSWCQWFSVVLGVAGTTYAILDHAGVLSNYRGEVIYSRYVLIDNVEYFTCHKQINYNGWVDESNPSSATIEELNTEYGPAVGGSSEMFESYIMQKDRARYIYRMENNE